MKVWRLFVVAMLTALVAVTLANNAIAAGEIMPDFANVPTGWTTDRYDPASFLNVGTFQGRANVLGITINSTTDLANRPGAYQSPFYNTQGKQYTFTPSAGPGSMIAADLYIPPSWGSAVNGNVRTDMWGVMQDISTSVSSYPIIGFTNYGGAPRYRVWDDDFGWVDLATPVTYGAWTRFSIKLLANTNIEFYLNDTLVYTDTNTYGSVAFKSVIMQAYNFADPSITGTVLRPYAAHWSNYPPTTGGIQTVYNAIPSALAGNYPSQPFQAQQAREFGDYIHLGETNRVLRTVDVTMSNWAKYSEYTGDIRYSGDPVSWTHPITLNIYGVGPVGPTGLHTIGALLGTVTQTVSIPWRPEADPTCPGGTAWRSGDGSCYNGLAATVTFDLSSLNLNLPNDIIVGVAYNTQTYGPAPIGSNGPYNSLNVAVTPGPATVGTDDSNDRVFLSSITAGVYTDGGIGGVDLFREDTGWAPSYGAVPFRITADPAPIVFTTGFTTPSLSNPTAWFIYNDENDTVDNSLGSIVTGPATPPLGSSSAQIAVSGSQRRNLATYQFSGTPLADIRTLKFSTYNASATNNTGSPSNSAFLYMNIDFNGSDTWQRRIVYVPSQNGTVVPDTWKEWDAVNGGNALWGYSGNTTWPLGVGGGGEPSGTAPGAVLKTWNQLLSQYPGIRIRVTDSNVGIRVGNPDPAGYTENIDAFKFGTTSSLKYFDFDVCPTISTPVTTSYRNLPVTIPVSTTNLTGQGVVSADFSVTFDSAVMTPTGTPVTAGSVWVGTNTVVTSNLVTLSGSMKKLVVSIYDASNPSTVAAGAGTLADLHFNVIGNAGTSSPLTVSNTLYNGGLVCTSTTSGSLTVAFRPTTTTVTSNHNPSTYGDSVTFTATVAGTPTPSGGTVNFAISGHPGCTNVLVAAGVATCTTNTLDAGNHSVVATYSGTIDDYAGSNGTLAGGQLVNKANAVFTVTPYNVTYDGNPHTATVSAITGVLGQTGATVGTIALNTTHTLPGIYNTDSYTFTGTPNYNSVGPVTITDTINSGTINGHVAYSITPATNVPGVLLSAPGSVFTSATTGIDGNYTLSNFGAGAYTVTPSRPTQLCSTEDGIDVNDASLVARHVVGILELTDDALRAAKVSGNVTPVLSSYDAALIARKVVGLCDGPNISGRWVFTPTSVAHPGGVIGSSLTENYTAYMMGDVDGNWNPGVSPNRPAPVDGSTDRGRAAAQASVPSVEGGRNSVVTIPFNISNLQGRNIDSYQFSIVYDPTVLEPIANSATGLGTLSSELSVVSNAPEPGLLKVGVYGVVPANGDGVYLNLRFRAIGGVGSTSPLTIDGFRFNDGSADYSVVNGQFTVTAASANGLVHGRLLTAGGQGVRNARVVLTSTTGATVTAMTGAFGYYEFTGLTIGETYIVSVDSKRFTFQPRTFSVTDNAVDLDMIADQ